MLEMFAWAWRRYSTLNSSFAMRRRSSRSSAGESSGSPIRARSAAPIRARETSVAERVADLGQDPVVHASLGARGLGRAAVHRLDDRVHEFPWPEPGQQR